MLKKIIFILILFHNITFAASYEDIIKQGDLYFSKRNVTITAIAIDNVNKAIEFYKKALDKKESEIIFYKLTKAVEFKYSFLLTEDKYHQEKWDTYKTLIDKLDNFCSKNNCNISKHILYSKAILIGRYGELMNVMEAATGGIADKIKDYAEKLLNLDSSFEHHAAYIILGRLHFKTPNIVFVLSWPDKNKSKEYLEKYLENEPDSLTGMYFLADTLWEIGEKERAKELYKKVLNAKPRENFYYEDNKAQEEVKVKF
jgi:tetratricopeptide (TPR) repeat protein